jgi:hypothetical protein
VKHRLDDQLKRDARTREQPVPAHMVARLRARLEREGAPEPSQPAAMSRPLLVAAAILVASGAAFWAVSRIAGDDAPARPTDAPSIVNEPPSVPAPVAGTISALGWPSRGFAFAARADEPLTREWENVKRDSITLLRGFERQLPRISPRD